MNKQSLATEFRKNADRVHLAKISPLYDEIIKECERFSRKGKYECLYNLGDRYSTEEIVILRDKLQASNFNVSFQTQYNSKYTPKWYEFKKKEEYDSEVLAYIEWKDK